MAMLVMNDVFARTWGDRVGSTPDSDYWPTVIPAVRQTHPEILFLAEAYWDLEWALQQQGFNYCYDKRLYDRILQGPAEQVGLHLLADDQLWLSLSHPAWSGGTFAFWSWAFGSLSEVTGHRLRAAWWLGLSRWPG
jgi:hypothetical protein